MTNLTGKRALVFGAGGSIGAGVAHELAHRGAEVFLSGPHEANVAVVAAEISGKGGAAHAAVVDAMDDSAVGTYIDRVAAQTGRIDIVFNAMGPRVADYANGREAVDLSVDQFMVPLLTLVRSQFITSHHAARIMGQQGSGVIILLTGSPARGHVTGATAIGTAFGALETFTENLAFELGSAGVRVACLRTTINIDSRTIQDTVDGISQHTGMSRDQIVENLKSFNVLKTHSRVEDTAKGVAFLASDDARMITCTVVNSSAGAALD